MDIGLWDQAFSHLEEAVEQGLVSEKELDRAVLLVLEQKFALGLFEHPYLDEEEPEDMDSEAYDDWGDRHEELEDLADEITDRLEAWAD